MTGQSEDNKPSLEVSPGEIRVTKLRNLWQRYKKTLSEGSKISLEDFVEYIKSHDTTLFDEITQTNHDDFLQGWEEKNKHFAHIVWGIIHPQEENGQNRREFLTTLTGATSALATSFLSGWTGPSIFDRETAEFVVKQVMRFGNALIGNERSTMYKHPVLLLHGPVKSWIQSIDFLGSKKRAIIDAIARSPRIDKMKTLKDDVTDETRKKDLTKSIETLKDWRIQLQIGDIGNTVEEIQLIKSTVIEPIINLLKTLPESIKNEINRNFLINRWGRRPSEIIRDCLQIHTVNLSKETKEDIQQVQQDIASYMTHYHGRAIVEDMLKREGVETAEQYLKIKEKELSKQQETTIEEITRACQTVINQVTIIERRYSPLSTN